MCMCIWMYVCMCVSDPNHGGHRLRTPVISQRIYIYIYIYTYMSIFYFKTMACPLSGPPN